MASDTTGAAPSTLDTEGAWWWILAIATVAAGMTLAFRRRGLKAAVMGQDGRASTSKTQVANANSGHGPVADASSDALAGRLSLKRVYVRDPVPDGVHGFGIGVAELLTGDDGAVAWADLQYVAFTLITLVYFTAQFLARPADGLPPVPAALLTLMGVSATTYAANKIVNTRGVNPKERAAT
jgi:hypothetical protein